MRVLLVEDDELIAESLQQGLGRYGYRVEWVRTGEEALAAAPSEMVLLDLGLPDRDGLDVCRTLRTRGDVPIIMISGRTDETERVVGLEVGADDYVTKPFGIREVIARMRAVARRTRPIGADAAWPGPAVAAGATAEARAAEDTSTAGVDSHGEFGAGRHDGFRSGRHGGSSIARPGRRGVERHGGLSIDRRTRRVYVDDRETAVTPKEYDLLAFLAEDAGALFTRERIMQSVWDANWFGPTKTLDAHVGTLRRKLGEVVRIETVRGVGYRLVVTS
jgi:two-component system, OmpR family, response regulator RegX3